MADADPGILAVACVVDSSLALATEWLRVLAEYISPLLKRLSDVYPGYQFRLGLVTYATAATRPTPLLSRRFFAPIQPITKELRDEPTVLGIGQTWDGGCGGMAALEGLIAATEMFDDLRSCLSQDQFRQSLGDERSNATPPICHIFHVAASPPDDALHPIWNRTSSFDDVNWETLPSELKKRDINLSMINLREFPRFSELHSSVAAGPSQQPWFNVRPPHHLLLSGFPSQQRVTKQPVENPIMEKVLEPKRSRALQPPSRNSPTTANVGVSIPVQVAASTTNLVPPPFNPSMQQSSLLHKPPTALQQTTQQQHILERLRIAGMQLQRMDDAIKNASASGNGQLAEDLRQARDKQLAMYVKFKTAVTFAQNQARATVAVVQDAAKGSGSDDVVPQAASSSTAAQIPPSAIPQLPHDQQPHPLGIGNTIHAHDMQSLPHHGSPASNTFLPIPNPKNTSHGLQMPSGVTPQIMSQMQKLMEQQRSRPTLFQGREQGATISTSMEQPKSHSGTAIWQGVLAWTGSDAATQGRKEVQSQVVATLQSSGESHSGTWPATLMLTPSRESAVSLQDLQIWMKRHKPVLCAFQPQARGTDPTVNEGHYRSLVQLLMSKGIYAVAAWPLPSGIQENNVLVFPVNGCGLAGAFYPLTGIPEYPKPGLGMNLPAALAAQLQKLPNEQRHQVIKQMMRQRHQIQMQRQQQQQQQQRHQQESLGAGGLQPEFNLVTASQQGVVTASGAQPSMNTTTQNGIGNMSYEIMQSFMQRSVEGGEPGLGSGG